MSVQQIQVLKAATTYVQRIHEERRRYPRVIVDRPVQLSGRNGTRVEVTLFDLSPDAVQVHCTRETAARLHPSGRYVMADDPPEVFLELRLPSPRGWTDVIVPCRMTYFSLREHDVAFGLSFDAPGESIGQAIEQFLSLNILPREAVPGLDGLEVEENIDEAEWAEASRL